MFKAVHNIKRRAHTVRNIGKFDNEYLHSDGNVYRTPEYWPTRELAQAVLDKWQHQHNEWQQVVETAHAAIEARMAKQVAEEAVRKARIEARKAAVRAADARAAMEAYQPPKPEHVWVHGDVFKRKSGTAMIYLVTHEMGPVVYLLNYSGPGKGMIDICLTDATFLFNIREKL